MINTLSGINKFKLTENRAMKKEVEYINITGRPELVWKTQEAKS